VEERVSARIVEEQVTRQTIPTTITGATTTWAEMMIQEAPAEEAMMVVVVEARKIANSA
jgi:hypothetical protein